MSTNPQPGPWVEAWLSAPRFGVYIEATAGDRQLALVLYEWNAAGKPSTRVPAKLAVNDRTHAAISGREPVTEKTTETAAIAVARSLVSYGGAYSAGSPLASSAWARAPANAGGPM